MKLIACLSFLLLFVVFPALSQEKHEAMKPVTITELAVEVEGGKALKMTAAALAKLTRKEVKAKGHDGFESTYSGYELRDILAPAGAKLGKDLRGPMIAQYLVVEAADGYRAVYSLTDLDPDFSDKIVLLADKRDGKTLENIGPWQVIATGEKKHARWVRQVTRLSVKIAKSQSSVWTKEVEKTSEGMTKDELVREVVFNHILQGWHSRSDLKAYCLSVDGKSDPSEILFSNLKRIEPKVRKDSECTIADDSSVESKATGEKGIRFTVSKLKWISPDKVTVDAGSYIGNMGADGCQYTLWMQDGAWKIVSKERCHIS